VVFYSVQQHRQAYGTHKRFPVSAKDSNMKNITVLGVDPGIENTGLAVIKAKTVGYSLITVETLKTSARDDTGKRLSIIHDEINDTLDAWHITGIAIERVFHNKNITSSLTTGAVIGILQFIAHQRGVPIHLFTPQQVKACAGIGAKIDKDTTKLVAS
jgi:crossover junction endodeoxyribonuclease RuvC